MARSTGPLLAIGAVTLLNQSILNDRPVDWRVPIATGGAAMLAALGEKAAPQLVPAIAWLALVTVLLTRITPGVPSPVESAAAWWQRGKVR